MGNNCKSINLAFIMLLAIAYSFLMGCQAEQNEHSSSAMSERHDIVSERNLKQWLLLLRSEYKQGGMSAFVRYREKLCAASKSLEEEPYHEIAAMVLGLSDTVVTEKEWALADELRDLAASIEERPGHSMEAWKSLRNKVYSYSHGNGPVDKYATPTIIVQLYKTIACSESP